MFMNHNNGIKGKLLIKRLELLENTKKIVEVTIIAPTNTEIPDILIQIPRIDLTNNTKNKKHTTKFKSSIWEEVLNTTLNNK